MKFNPEKLSIPDERMKPFIDPEEIWGLINSVKPDKQRVRDVIAKSLQKTGLHLKRPRFWSTPAVQILWMR